MSWQAQEAARRYSRARGGARMLLFAIASYAGPDGSGAFPGLHQLCEDTKLSERAVRYCLRKLEALGEVETILHGGPQGVNRYRVTLVDGQMPSVGAKKRPSGGAKFAASPPPEAPEARQRLPLGQNATRVGQYATGVGQPVAPDPSPDPSHDPPGQEERVARARPVLATPKPGQVEAAELAACPLWLALTDRAGPPSAAKRAEWVAERRDLLGERARGESADDLAARLPSVWDEAGRWPDGMRSGVAVLRHFWELADLATRRVARESARASPRAGDDLVSAQPKRTQHNIAVLERFLERHGDEPEDIRATPGRLDRGHQPAAQRSADRALVAQVRPPRRGDLRRGG